MRNPKNSITTDSRAGYGARREYSQTKHDGHTEQLSNVARTKRGECLPPLATLVHRCEVDRWAMKLRNQIREQNRFQSDHSEQISERSQNAPPNEQQNSRDTSMRREIIQMHTPRFLGEESLPERF